MGGGLTREKYVNNNSTGLTEILNMIPSMSIGGTKDGQYRISRGAEGYYHQVENIDP